MIAFLVLDFCPYRMYQRDFCSFWGRFQGETLFIPEFRDGTVGWFVGSLASYGSLSQGQIKYENCTHCQAEIEVAHHTCCVIRSQCTDTEPTSPTIDSITPDAW